MKIGLLTFHDTNNFGSYLQTYGLYKKIIDLGHECEIVDYQCEAILRRESFGAFKFSISPREILKDVFINRVLRKKYHNLMNWLLKNAKVSRAYFQKNIHESKPFYDKFLVGSDIVWGMDIIEGDTTYFLDFVDDKKKKYAFASSIGNPWSNDDKAIIKPLLKNFSRIAVREEESAIWVEELIGSQPEVVCDPTMLLNAEEWKEFVSDKYNGDKYVLVYFPTKENLEVAKSYAHAHGLKCYVINHGLPISGTTSVKPTTMEDFLSLFYNATFVSTASYHGMLFSIYFKRQFAYFNRAHKSRMNTLARKLHVSDREGNVYDVHKMVPINYTKVSAAVEEYRNYSIQILKEMLEE